MIKHRLLWVECGRDTLRNSTGRQPAYRLALVWRPRPDLTAPYCEVAASYRFEIGVKLPRIQWRPGWLFWYHGRVKPSRGQQQPHPNSRCAVAEDAQ